MSSIKLHLEQAEYNAVSRFAESIGVSAEEVVYAALNRAMMQGSDPALARDVLETRDWRKNNLPLWSDSAGSVHAYEGKPDDEPEPSRMFRDESS